MTYQEILSSTKDVLTPADIAPVLGCDPQKIRIQAKQIPESIPFRFMFIGNRMKIPRLGFIAWAEGKKEEETQRKAALAEDTMIRAIAPAMKKRHAEQARKGRKARTNAALARLGIPLRVL